MFSLGPVEWRFLFSSLNNEKSTIKVLFHFFSYFLQRPNKAKGKIFVYFQFLDVTALVHSEFKMSALPSATSVMHRILKGEFFPFFYLIKYLDFVWFLGTMRERKWDLNKIF